MELHDILYSQGFGARRTCLGLVQQGLVTCWRAANGICSKRLVPYLPELVRVLEEHGELHLEAQTKARLLALSPATAEEAVRRLGAIAPVVVTATGPTYRDRTFAGLRFCTRIAPVLTTRGVA